MNTEPTLALDPLVLPHAPSWFPLAWGWWATLAFVVITIIALILTVRIHRSRRKAKRTALSLFAQGNIATSPSAALELLRQAALCYYPRETIASLNGDAWYQFLDEQIGEARFMPKLEQWQAALYQTVSNEECDNRTLIQDCYDWVAKALPPKRGRRG
ncbi:DUF4381 domain-containing protein [Vibrio sp. SM6]|uniref:DUF4381 domain-containing protein n=1 Tax=Vibrio agarilyticus TaxID=2726741 RepID=A0A7X8TN14_9VIBR|nr:DUF4381 domain-containing protein [Vibrio agarilyticus]NLS11750.1 DUF4381 domain-containing protein [Vibrio agarilyticus]